MLSVRKLVFAGALLAVAPFAFADAPKTAEAPKAEPKAMPATPAAPAVTATSTGNCGGTVAAAPAGCGPTYTTVKKTIMVPTEVEETRTVYKPVQKVETYTYNKIETVQEKKIIDVTTYKTVTETVMEPRTTCVKVPVWEEKCVMETRKKIEWVTETREKCKLSFSKECKTIGCGTGCGDGCGHGCGGFSLSFPVVKPQITKECVQVCVPKCVTECVPVTKKVCTYRTETKTEMVPVCKTKCVPCVEKKEIIECKKVCVPCTGTRTVTVCEPVCEKVKVCKMVPTVVEEQVACGPATSGCGNACGNNACGSDACGSNACGSGCGLFNGCGLFSKLKSCLPSCSLPSCKPSCGGLHLNFCNPCGGKSICCH